MNYVLSDSVVATNDVAIVETSFGKTKNNVLIHVVSLLSLSCWGVLRQIEVIDYLSPTNKLSNFAFVYHKQKACDCQVRGAKTRWHRHYHRPTGFSTSLFVTGCFSIICVQQSGVAFALADSFASGNLRFCSIVRWFIFRVFLVAAGSNRFCSQCVVVATLLFDIETNHQRRRASSVIAESAAFVGVRTAQRELGPVRQQQRRHCIDRRYRRWGRRCELGWMMMMFVLCLIYVCFVIVARPSAIGYENMKQFDAN